jgi:hypothetical protein
MAFSPSDLSGPLIAFAPHEQSKQMSTGKRECSLAVAARQNAIRGEAGFPDIGIFFLLASTLSTNERSTSRRLALR